MDVSVAVEGFSDEGAAQAILNSCGLGVRKFFGGHGKHALLKKLPGYNAGAAFSPWLVLIDLDNDAYCPGQKCSDWLSDPSDLMCFRIVVRSIESWLLADAVAISRFLGVRKGVVPPCPEDLPDPKETVISLARRSSNRLIRDGLVPREGSGARVGPTYASDIREFARSQWRPEVAAEAAPSLKKSMDRIRELAAKLDV
jgi:hypothetical protein